MPETACTVPIGKAQIAREGTDVTVIGIGYTTHVCLQAAGQLETQGYSPEVIDLLALSLMDDEIILESVRKTRTIVILDEDHPRCSINDGISALVAVEAFGYLDAPPRRVTHTHPCEPYSHPLEALYLPDKNKVVAAVHEVLH